MNIERQRKILEVAKFIIENKATINMAAQQFNLSTSSIKKYINNLENLQSIDMEIYKEVKEVQKEIESIGHYVGGKNGIRGPQYTEFEGLEIAETMIAEGLTLEQASTRFNIPKSTLYETLKRIDDEEVEEELKNLFDSNNSRFGGNKNK